MRNVIEINVIQLIYNFSILLRPFHNSSRKKYLNNYTLVNLLAGCFNRSTMYIKIMAILLLECSIRSTKDSISLYKCTAVYEKNLFYMQLVSPFIVLLLQPSRYGLRTHPYVRRLRLLPYELLPQKGDEIFHTKSNVIFHIVTQGHCTVEVVSE